MADTNEAFTDLVITIPGDHGIEDHRIWKIIDRAARKIERYLGADTLLSSQLSNEDNETYFSMKDDRDLAREEVARLRTILEEHGIAFDPKEGSQHENQKEADRG